MADSNWTNSLAAPQKSYVLNDKGKSYQYPKAVREAKMIWVITVNQKWKVLMQIFTILNSYWFKKIYNSLVWFVIKNDWNQANIKKNDVKNLELPESFNQMNQK